MVKRIRLTETSIKRLQPRDREFTVWDTRLAGFGVRVRATGTIFAMQIAVLVILL